MSDIEEIIAHDSYCTGGYCTGICHEMKPCDYVNQCGICVYVSFPEDTENYYVMGCGVPIKKCKRDYPGIRKMTKHDFFEYYKGLSCYERLRFPIMDTLEQCKIIGIVVD